MDSHVTLRDWKSPVFWCLNTAQFHFQLEDDWYSTDASGLGGRGSRLGHWWSICIQSRHSSVLLGLRGLDSLWTLGGARISDLYNPGMCNLG